MYGMERHAYLRILTGESRHDYSQDEREEMSRIEKSIRHLSERVRTLAKRDRIKMITHGRPVNVWRIESAIIRGMQVYASKDALWVQMPCGAIKPCGVMGPRSTHSEELSAKELNFIAQCI